MALLAAEPDATLDLSTDLDPSGCDRLWVFQAIPTHDAKLTRELRKRAIPHYSPMGVREWHDGNRLQRKPTPLFPGYVIALADPVAPYRVRDESPYCLGLIDVYDQFRLLHELRMVDKLLRSGSPVVPEPELHPGQHVRVLSGPFEGVVGTVVRVKGKDRLVVHVDTLGQRVRVEFKGWQVECVGC